jgi:hypothetical protein
VAHHESRVQVPIDKARSHDTDGTLACLQVTLVQSMWPCISMRCKGFAWDSDLKPTQDSAEYLEESLVWLTLLSR